MTKKASVVHKTDSAKTGAGKLKVEWKGYVNIDLTSTEKEGMVGWEASVDLWGNILPSILDSSYVLSVSFDSYHDCFVAGLYCQWTEHDNAGYKLTMRGADPYTALVRVIFVHDVVLGGNWLERSREKSKDW